MFQHSKSHMGTYSTLRAQGGLFSPPTPHGSPSSLQLGQGQGRARACVCWCVSACVCPVDGARERDSPNPSQNTQVWAQRSLSFAASVVGGWEVGTRSEN